MKNYIDGEVNKKEFENIIDPNKDYVIFQKDAFDEMEKIQKKLQILCCLGGFVIGITIASLTAIWIFL